MRMLDDPDFDCAPESFGYPHSDDDAFPVEVGPGSVVGASFGRPTPQLGP
jgi:hypothetical protein